MIPYKKAGEICTPPLLAATAALNSKLHGGFKPCHLKWEFLRIMGPRDPKEYIGIIRGLYRAPLRDYIGVILRDTQFWNPERTGFRV